MPSKTRRRTGFRRFRSQKREFIWASTYIIADATLLDGTSDGLNIVEPDDWARDIANVDVLEKGAVLTRVIGDVFFRTDNGSGTVSLGGASYLWGIRKTDFDDSSIPAIPTTWFQEDWMHTEAGQIAPNNAVTSAYAPQPFSYHRGLDIRVKRKLTTDEKVEFLFAGFPVTGVASATEFLVADYYFRSLIQLP